MSDPVELHAVRDFLIGQLQELIGPLPEDLDGATPLFDLGIESISAVQLVIAVRDRYGIDLSIKTFFEAPTLDGLAGAITEAVK